MHHSCGEFHQILHYIFWALEIHQREPGSTAFQTNQECIPETEFLFCLESQVSDMALTWIFV